MFSAAIPLAAITIGTEGFNRGQSERSASVGAASIAGININA